MPTKPPTADEVVAAVLKRALSAQRFAKRLFQAYCQDTDHTTDLPEVESGGFVPHRDVRDRYEDDLSELSLLEGWLSVTRLKALAEGAKPTPREEALYARKRLKAYLAEPVEGEAYCILSLADSRGRTVFWTEIRSGSSWEGVETRFVGVFRSLQESKAALRRKGLIDVKDYVWRDRRSSLAKTKA